MYHQEMIPTPLLLSIIEAKQNVPFSTALEIMGMLISFELLQEAGLRLPNPIGDTVSIIGALIVGQSAVEAQVVSPIAIIVVAVSGIAGYTLPSQDFGSAIRLLRFALVIASILAGFFGVGAALCLLTLHLADIDSFGVDYTAPLSDGEPSPLRRLLLQSRSPSTSSATRTSKLRIKGGRNEKSDLRYPCACVRVYAHGLHKRVLKLQRDRTAARHSGHGARQAGRGVLLSLCSASDESTGNVPKRLYGTGDSITTALEHIYNYSFEDILFCSHISHVLIGEKSRRERNRRLSVLYLPLPR